MLGLISLRFFVWSGHFGAFRSIVGEAPEAGIESAKLAMRIADEHRSSAREPALQLAIPTSTPIKVALRVSCREDGVLTQSGRMPSVPAAPIERAPSI
jgi:hypothetical protein